MVNREASKNVFLINWDNTRPAFMKAALEMQKMGYQILYCVVSNKSEIVNYKKQFTHTQFHGHDDAITLVPPPEINEAELLPPGEDLIKNFYGLESVLTTMKKFYLLSSSMLEKKHLFHRLVCYWYGMINKYKPEIIFFSGLPHSVFDYTIYCLAKFLKIRTIMFEYTNISDRFMPAVDFDRGNAALREEYGKNRQQQFKVDDLSQDIKEFYLWHLNNKSGKIQPLLINSLKDVTGLNRYKIKLRVFIKSIKNFSLLNLTARYLKKIFGPNIKKEYTALQIAPDYSKKYIYLALHYQPESSTSPLGGVFVDQILMIKILSFALPKDWLIYVKEHPVSWAMSNLAYSEFRYKGYYEEIAKIKNVKIVPIETNSHELIVNSRAVCSVSGSCGMEALLRSKPALFFGYIWHRDCPGVFNIKDVESCSQALEKINSRPKVDQQQIINFLYSLDKVSYHLNICSTSEKFSNASESEVAQTIAEVLTNEANKINLLLKN